MNAIAFLWIIAIVISTGYFLFVMVKLALEGNGIRWLMIFFIIAFVIVGCRGWR